METNRLNPMDKLDIEYLHILSIIKPFITCIMDNDYIEMIKLWLEKLSNDGRVDKMLRNQYLVCLGKQIEREVLERPFNEAPPEYLDPIEDLKEMAGGGVVIEVDSEELQVVLRKGKSAPRCGKRRKLRKSVYTKTSEHSDSSWQDLSDENNNDCASGDAPTINSFHETSYNSLKYQSDVNKLMNVIDKLRVENAALNQIVEGCTGSGKGNREIQNIVSEVETLKSRLHELLNIKSALQSSHFSVASEWQNAISSLHRRLGGMQRKNSELKNVVHHLEEKLNDALKKNSAAPQKCLLLTEMHKKEVDLLKQKHKEELNKLENELADRLSEKCAGFTEKFEDLQKWYEKQLAEMQAENERSLKEFYGKQVEEMRSEFEREMRQICDSKEAQATEERKREMEEKEESRNKFYERRLEEVKCEHEKEVAFKDSEIERLETLLQEQCKRMQEEVQTIRDQLQTGVSSDDASNEKIAYLQKCVMKLDRMYRKAEKEYAKQLLKLRREMDMREKHNQILMGTQRVNLISTSSANKQIEIDGIVNKLEQHYKNLLIEQQKEAMEQRRNDQRIISELRGDLAYLKAKSV